MYNTLQILHNITRSNTEKVINYSLSSKSTQKECINCNKLSPEAYIVTDKSKIHLLRFTTKKRYPPVRAIRRVFYKVNIECISESTDRFRSRHSGAELELASKRDKLLAIKTKSQPCYR